MNEEKNRKIILFAFITIPIFTFILGISKSPFNYTFSMIGNWFNYRLEFIIWGILTGILLVIFLVHLFREANFRNKRSLRYAYASGFFLILSVLTPTKIKGPVEKALRGFSFDLHLFWSLAFIVLLVFSLYSFSKYLASMNKKLSIKSLKFLLITVGGSMLFLTIFGMTGIFELFFFMSLVIYLLILEKNIFKIRRKEKKEKRKLQ